MPRKIAQLTKVAGLTGVYEARGPDGSLAYLVRVQWTDPRTRKVKSRTGMAPAIRDAVVLRSELKAASRPQAKPARLSDYVKSWMELHSAELADSTKARYAVELSHAAAPPLGDIFVDLLTYGDIAVWRNAMIGSCSAQTLNSRLRTLRVVLEPLARDGVLRRNPARDVRELRGRTRTKGARGRSIAPQLFLPILRTIGELVALRTVSPDAARMVMVHASTGMRKGELCALKFSQIQGSRLRIDRAVWRRREKPTKTDDPREIVISEELSQVFVDQRRWLVETRHPGLSSGLVFPAAPRQALQAKQRFGYETVSWYRGSDVVNAVLTKACAKLGIERVTTHSFRRTFENLMRQAGVSETVRRALAGWRTEEAQEIYAGISEHEMSDATRRFAKFVKDADEASRPGGGAQSEDGSGPGSQEDGEKNRGRRH